MEVERSFTKDHWLKCNKSRYKEERDNEKNIAGNKETMQSLPKRSQKKQLSNVITETQ